MPGSIRQPDGPTPVDTDLAARRQRRMSSTPAQTQKRSTPVSILFYRKFAKTVAERGYCHPAYRYVVMGRGKQFSPVGTAQVIATRKPSSIPPPYVDPASQSVGESVDRRELKPAAMSVSPVPHIAARLLAAHNHVWNRPPASEPARSNATASQNVSQAPHMSGLRRSR